MICQRLHGYFVIILVSTLAFEYNKIKPGIDLNRIDSLLVNYLKSTGVDVVPGKIRNRGTKVIRICSTLNLPHFVGWLYFLKQVSPRGSLLFPWQC